MKIAFVPALGTNIGFGHYMRCIAIATQITAFSHEVDFVIPSSTYDTFTKKKKFRIRRSLRRGEKYDVLVIDKYDVGELLLTSYKKLCKTLIRVDDSSPKMKVDRISDVIINGNPYATEEMYQDYVRKDCLLLVGADYVPMDSGFCSIRSRYKVRTDLENILITFGQSAKGAAFASNICKTISTYFRDLRIVVLNGKGLDDSYSPNIKLLPFTDNVYNEFLSADVAVCSSSTTCWQLVAIGIPFVTFKTASNQSRIFDYIEKKKIAVPLKYECISNGELLNTISNLSYSQRQKYYKLGRKIIDCKGAQRIVRELLRIVQ